MVAEESKKSAHLYDVRLMSLLNAQLFDIETKTYQRLAAFAEAERHASCLLGSAGHLLIPLATAHDVSLAAVDIQRKPPEMWPEWTLDNQSVSPCFPPLLPDTFRDFLAETEYAGTSDA